MCLWIFTVKRWPSQADSWYQFSKLLSFVSCNPDPLISGESKSPQQGSVRRKKAPQASALLSTLHSTLSKIASAKRRSIGVKRLTQYWSTFFCFYTLHCF